MMSLVATNEETIRSAIEHFNRTGEPLWEAYAEDLVFVTRGELTGGTEYHGRDGFRRAIAEFAESWAEIRPEIVSLDAHGDDAFLIHYRFHLRAHSGVELAADEWWAAWMREGRIARAEQFGVRADAIAALER